MAVNIDFDTLVVISNNSFMKDTVDYSTLNYKPVTKHVPASILTSAKAKGSSKTESKVALTADSIVDACNENLSLISEVEKEIYNRCKGLTKTVNQNSEDLLYKACKRLYGSTFAGKITFDMYLQALNYNNNLCQKLRAPAV